MGADRVRITGGWVYVDGAKVARVVERGGRPCLEFLDRDRRRSSERGSRTILADVEELADAVRRECGDTEGGTHDDDQ